MDGFSDERAADAIVIIGVDGDFVPTLTRYGVGQKYTTVQNDKVYQRFGHPSEDTIQACLNRH
jgi:hypothetical protein